MRSMKGFSNTIVLIAVSVRVPRAKLDCGLCSVSVVSAFLAIMLLINIDERDTGFCQYGE